ncbi:hypothetical protein MPQ_1037 [Methylovorus sp. MP688]|nr:hypothetical protein MPQ_1037 [Methylovorus sp. MP688]
MTVPALIRHSHFHSHLKGEQHPPCQRSCHGFNMKLRKETPGANDRG